MREDGGNIFYQQFWIMLGVILVNFMQDEFIFLDACSTRMIIYPVTKLTIP